MGSVRKIRVRSLALAGLAACAALVAALPALAEVTRIPRSIAFAPDSGVPEAVKAECALETKVPDFIKHFGGDAVEVVDGALDPKKGRVLRMEITEVHAPGGGAFSGPKWMTVKGELFENGKSIGSFRAKRFSTGGAFGGFKGTCAIIGRCTKAIGQDIASWMQSPTPNAELGDAR
jgi:hypothetical protein